MPRHRAPSSGSRALNAVAATSAAFTASLLWPLAVPLTAAGADNTAPSSRVSLALAGLPSLPSATAAGAQRCTQVSADELDSALDDAEPGEDVCVPGHRSRGHHPGHDRRASDPHTEATNRPHSWARAMTSGERQYRNGCEQGYIAEHCEQFSVEHLLRDGIDPFQ